MERVDSDLVSQGPQSANEILVQPVAMEPIKIVGTEFVVMAMIANGPNAGISWMQTPVPFRLLRIFPH